MISDVLTSLPPAIASIVPIGMNNVTVVGAISTIAPALPGLFASLTVPPAPVGLEMPTVPPIPAVVPTAPASEPLKIEMPTVPPMPSLEVPTVPPVDGATSKDGGLLTSNPSKDGGLLTSDPSKEGATSRGETDPIEKAHFSLDPSNTFMAWNTVIGGLKPFIIPLIGLVCGTVMMQSKTPSIVTVGKLVLYFGAQCFMNIYMGWVMRTSVTVPKGTVLESGYTLQKDLTGCPAGFALTAMQQVISFVVFCLFYVSVYPTPYRYRPKALNSAFEVFTVIIFGCVFALNIALNNFSLGYINVAVNLIIRSCLPLTTFLSQQVLAMFGMYTRKPCRCLEISLMVIGVFCAGAFTTARIMGTAAKGDAKESGMQFLGVCVCLLSLLCGSLNLALAGVLGQNKLNVYDTVAYMAIPATVFLAPIALFVQKEVPGEWPKVFGKDTMSDWEIISGTWALNKTTMAWLILSGVFSFLYNIVQFSIVHTLSPSATAFGGNFNKAALIFLTLLLPFLRVHELPGPPYIQVIWGAVIINIMAFSYYSYLQIEQKKAEERNQAMKALKDADDSDEEDEDDEESSDAEGCC